MKTQKKLNSVRTITEAKMSKYRDKTLLEKVMKKIRLESSIQKTAVLKVILELGKHKSVS